MIRYLTIIVIIISCRPNTSETRIKDLVLKETDIYLFDVVKEESDNPIDWLIKPRTEKLIPDTEAHCIVRAKMIDSDKTMTDCFINISLPERIVDFVIFMTDKGLDFKQLYELTGQDVIPAIASEAYGVYELYYSKNNPNVGIEILKQGLSLSNEPSVIAEDLGYILRDENRFQEAIEAFLISEKHGVTNNYIYQEIRDLYIQLNNMEKANEYDKIIEDKL